GIIGGVFLANLFLSPMKADLLFGLAHSALSLGITIVAARYITNKLTLMLVNSVVFSFNIFIIAYMLKIFVGFEFSFLFFSIILLLIIVLKYSLVLNFLFFSIWELHKLLIF